MESSSTNKACLLKIESSMSGCDKSLEKLLTNYDVNFMIDKGNKTVYVHGKFDPEVILEKIIKSDKKAEIIWSNYGRKNQPQNRKDQLMEQCYASGSMNAPNGFFNNHQNQCYASGYMNAPNGYSNYHQNQGYYPPPPNWMMNQLQPYYQPFGGIPPPYTRQLHPQPPPPPPYEFYQSAPVAKSFPPTPAPPKNFAMGDLQPGCMIM